MDMNKPILYMLAAFLSLPVAAQKAPKWMDKSMKAVLRVTTFDKNNNKINSTGGFFVTETGEALSAYSLFNGAAKATVTDTEGKTYPVTYIIGADDLYDVIRFKVAVQKKVPFLPLAADPAPEGSPVFMMPYGGTFLQGNVTEVSKLKDSYSYYKLSFPIEKEQTNSPLLLAGGQVFALTQEDASGKKEHSYGVSATYVNSLSMSTADVFNTVYTRVGIRKMWPLDAEQAAVALFLQAASQDAATYLETLNDFVATFPDAADGYMSRASHYVNKRAELAADAAGQSACLDMANADILKSIRLNPNKGEAYYNRAKLIYAVAAGDTSITSGDWTMAAALLAVDNAIQTEDLPAYRELEGNIYFFVEDYPAAYESYMRVNDSPSASSASYYSAVEALKRIPGVQISHIIELLDSVIVRMGVPVPPQAAPYVLERVEYKTQLSLYAEAVEDYNLYHSLTEGKVNDSFYFFREQAKLQSGDNDGALLDIRQAISMNEQMPDYYAEEAAVLVRMQNYDDALASVQKALDLAPDFGACYRIRGICLIRGEKKPEACEAFNKAAELGDPLVARLIREHCR
ncbi:MAG: serine protease [Tannerellaceae bacterium]|jgi:tetratricopeptide (TPR) repeat protein|nr:serine protease [Tannerellaceae bacterium]